MEAGNNGTINVMASSALQCQVQRGVKRTILLRALSGGIDRAFATHFALLIPGQLAVVIQLNLDETLMSISPASKHIDGM